MPIQGLKKPLPFGNQRDNVLRSKAFESLSVCSLTCFVIFVSKLQLRCN